MGTKSYRVTISFDTDKEYDIISWLNKLGETRKIGEVLTNLIRVCFTDNSKLLKNINTTSLLAERNSFFNELRGKIAEQDSKIDGIYSMCEDMYCLARMNKVLNLEDKTDELMISQFTLQHLESKLKYSLGENGLHVYMSDKIPNEKEKADKICEYIASAYETMLMEVKTSLTREVPVYVEKIEKETDKPVSQDEQVEEIDDDDEIIELVQPPMDKDSIKKDDYTTVQELDDDMADVFLAMLGED